MAGLGSHLRVEKHLQQQIAEFVEQVGPILPIDGIQHFIGFLNRVLADGGEVLRTIPWASAGRAQAGMISTERKNSCSKSVVLAG